MHKKGHGSSRGSRKPVEQKKYSSKGSRGTRKPNQEPKTAGVGKNRVPTSKKTKKEEVQEIVNKKAVKKRLGSRGTRKPVEQPTYTSKGKGSRGTRKPAESPVVETKKSKNKILDKLNIKLKKPKSIKMRKTMSGYRRK